MVIVSFPPGQRLVFGPRGLPPLALPALGSVQLDGDGFLNDLLADLRVLDLGVARGLGGESLFDSGAFAVLRLQWFAQIVLPVGVRGVTEAFSVAAFPFFLL